MIIEPQNEMVSSEGEGGFSLPSPGRFVNQARLDQGLEIDHLARKTCIPVLNLRALEDDRYHDLPARVYVRGYLKALARELEQDPELWMAAYDDISEPDKLKVRGHKQDGMIPRPVMGEAISIPFRVGHVLAVIFAIMAFFMVYFALEGRGTEQESAVSSQEGSLIEMLDTRPVQKQ